MKVTELSIMTSIHIPIANLIEICVPVIAGYVVIGFIIHLGVDSRMER